METAPGWSELSPSCPEAPPALLAAPFHTGDELLAVVRFLKFSGGRAAVPSLGWWMSATLADLTASLPDRDSFRPLLVPVPLHPARKRSRGYNQALLLAREIARRLGLEVDSSILARLKNTKAQSSLDRAERPANVKGAFGLDLPAPAAGRDIVLIDDLVTTGETARACVAALRDAFPRSVTVLAAGRVRY